MRLAGLVLAMWFAIPGLVVDGVRTEGLRPEGEFEVEVQMPYTYRVYDQDGNEGRVLVFKTETWKQPDWGLHRYETDDGRLICLACSPVQCFGCHKEWRP